MQCSSIPKRHEEGAFVCSFWNRIYMCILKECSESVFFFCIELSGRGAISIRAFFILFYGLNATNIFLLCQTFEQ